MMTRLKAVLGAAAALIVWFALCLAVLDARSDAEIASRVSAEWAALTLAMHENHWPLETACPFYTNNGQWLPEGTRASFNQVCGVNHD